MLPELEKRLKNLQKFVNGAQDLIDAMNMLTWYESEEDWVDDTEYFLNTCKGAIEIYHEDTIIAYCDDYEKVSKHVDEVLDCLINGVLTQPENYESLLWEYQHISMVVGSAMIGRHQLGRQQS